MTSSGLRRDKWPTFRAGQPIPLLPGTMAERIKLCAPLCHIGVFAATEGRYLRRLCGLCLNSFLELSALDLNIDFRLHRIEGPLDLRQPAQVRPSCKDEPAIGKKNVRSRGARCDLRRKRDIACHLECGCQG